MTNRIALPKTKTEKVNAMAKEKLTCLINESDCGREGGNPVCAKCGMDERVVYPGQEDLIAALEAARTRYAIPKAGEIKHQTEIDAKEQDAHSIPDDLFKSFDVTAYAGLFLGGIWAAIIIYEGRYESIFSPAMYFLVGLFAYIFKRIRINLLHIPFVLLSIACALSFWNDLPNKSVFWDFSKIRSAGEVFTLLWVYVAAWYLFFGPLVWIPIASIFKKWKLLKVKDSA